MINVDMGFLTVFVIVVCLRAHLSIRPSCCMSCLVSPSLHVTTLTNKCSHASQNDSKLI